jgi:G3E family GTPase
MAESSPTPVTVVTGFLGAGKTTLVNRWLADVERGEIAVIVNEIGKVGIDGALLSARVRAIIEIAGGCVCCSTQAELVRALAELASAPLPPKRIVVETSGAASPAGVVHAVAGSAPHGAHTLDGIITVVDATRMEVLSAYELALEQVGFADVVVLSRVDQCAPEARLRARALIEEHNGAALIATASRGEFDDPAFATLEALLAQRRADFAPAQPSPRRTSEHVFESISLVLDGELDGDLFAEFMETELERFSGRLLRSKGILAVEGLPTRMIVQGVADRFELSFGEPWDEQPRTSRLVVVGFGLEREALTRAFSACAAAGG